MEDRIKITIENLKKDLIELRSQIWERLSDAQKEEYYRNKVDMEDKFTLKDCIYVAIDPEVARKLIKQHEKDWEPFDEFNGFYHCLLATLEDFDNRFEPKKKESEF